MYIFIPEIQAPNANVLKLNDGTLAYCNGNIEVELFQVSEKNNFTEAEMQECIALDGIFFEDSNDVYTWRSQYGYCEMDLDTNEWVAYAN